MSSPLAGFYTPEQHMATGLRGRRRCSENEISDAVDMRRLWFHTRFRVNKKAAPEDGF
jgi:hypothetical protein